STNIVTVRKEISRTYGAIDSTWRILGKDSYRTSPSCEEIQDSAFESHVNCYLQCDFCNICKSEKLALLKSYDLLDFFSRKGISATFQILKACGPLSCFLPP
uniref:DUF4206 domain-containing protein n=1 Tax=Angiostrongylus cantonensis TaxID=6313 RepID=A0A0K0CSZ9_ANGCA